jgi:hypothetical protein
MTLFLTTAGGKNNDNGLAIAAAFQAAVCAK